MPSTTPCAFLERLSNSKLLTAEQLAAVRAAAGDDEKTLVAHLLSTNLLTRFQVRQLKAGATSFFIGKYVVIDCVGRGANGIVFKARHRLMNNREVALKTIDTRSLHDSDDSVARFRREIDIVSRLDHPNVVRALDVLQTRTQIYLVLEYAPGQDLGRVIKERGRLPIGEAVDYAVQAARGLHYAHGLGIIHRDIKPANLMLTNEGTVKLLDLGLARLFTQEPSGELTIKGTALGTPEFMAPEQAEDAHSADIRSDLYSLGATLFHLLTAELPVEGSSYLHRLQHLLTLPAKPLREARSECPEGLAAVVDRLRARNRADRPADAGEVIALLQPYARKPADDPRSWDGRRKAALVLELLRGQVTRDAISTRYTIPVSELEAWQRCFLEAAERALDPAAASATSPVEQLRQLHAKIGAQAMEIETLKKQLNVSA
jgi:serine/threonine-protein kinase